LTQSNTRGRAPASAEVLHRLDALEVGFEELFCFLHQALHEIVQQQSEPPAWPSNEAQAQSSPVQPAAVAAVSCIAGPEARAAPPRLPTVNIAKTGPKLLVNAQLQLLERQPETTPEQNPAVVVDKAKFQFQPQKRQQLAVPVPTPVVAESAKPSRVISGVYHGSSLLSCDSDDGTTNISPATVQMKRNSSFTDETAPIRPVSEAKCSSWGTMSRKDGDSDGFSESECGDKDRPSSTSSKQQKADAISREEQAPSLTAGDTVEVVTAFGVDNYGKATFHDIGEIGVVKEIDADGNALVKFDNRVDSHQIAHDDFFKLRKAGGSESSRNNLSKRARNLQKRNSQRLWNSASQSIIVFDWDDTLFPSTWVLQDMALRDVEKPLENDTIRQSLEECATRALEILEVAKALAERVVIVTLAKPGWIDKTIATYAPSMAGQLDILNINVVCARSFMDANDKRPDRWMRAKADAIAQECESFYSKYEGQSWKNVVAIGDSEVEIMGSHMTVRQWTYDHRRTACQIPRLKTVKLLDEPSCKELCTQLRIVKLLLRNLCLHDASCCLDLCDIRKNLTFSQVKDLLTKSGKQTEPPWEALVESRLWKLCQNSDPCDPDRWRPRRVWLSQQGRLWYESLKDVKPSCLFAGALISDLAVESGADFMVRDADSRLTPSNARPASPSGRQLYAMKFALKSESPEGGKEVVFAAEDENLRKKWLDACTSFTPSFSDLIDSRISLSPEHFARRGSGTTLSPEHYTRMDSGNSTPGIADANDQGGSSGAAVGKWFPLFSSFGMTPSESSGSFNSVEYKDLEENKPSPEPSLIEPALAG